MRSSSLSGRIIHVFQVERASSCFWTVWASWRLCFSSLRLLYWLTAQEVGAALWKSDVSLQPVFCLLHQERNKTLAAWFLMNKLNIFTLRGKKWKTGLKKTLNGAQNQHRRQEWDSGSQLLHSVRVCVYFHEWIRVGHLSQNTIHYSVFRASINSFLHDQLVESRLWITMDVFCDFIPRHQRLNLKRPTESKTLAIFRTAVQLILESFESLTLFPPDRPRTGETSAPFIALSLFSGSRGEHKRRLVGTIPACGCGGREGGSAAV